MKKSHTALVFLCITVFVLATHTADTLLITESDQYELEFGSDINESYHLENFAFA